MCKSNSMEQICGFKLADYIAKKKTGKSPPIQFCAGIRGAILNSLLELSDRETTRGPSPTYDAKIISSSELFWQLANHCNVNHGRADETGGYNRVVLRGFKALVKYIQRKAIEFGALINLPAGWTRAPGCCFTSDDEAGAWLNGKLKDYASGSNKTPLAPRPDKSINKPKGAGLSSSRWNSSKSDALPDLSQLSLDEGEELPSIVVGKGDPMKVLSSSARARAEAIASWCEGVKAGTPASPRVDLEKQLAVLAKARNDKWKEMQQIDRQLKALVG